MVATATSTDILDEVRNGPHWKVVIHPQEFERERIATLDECWAAVGESQVRLRGWPYPHLDRAHGEVGADWIASHVEAFNGQREYWRFFQSGQFVHYFGFWEDEQDWRSKLEAAYKKSPFKRDGFLPTGFLGVNNALYTFTEIFEFTARLMATGALGARHEAPVVRIGMDKIKDRALSVPSIRAWKLYLATTESLEHSWRVGGLGTHDEAAGQAREATRWFLDRFGVRLPDVELKNEQEKFFQKRWWR